jgi:haloalkane dehalogenase
MFNITLSNTVPRWSAAMEILRTPDARFENLPEYAFAPHYTEIHTEDGTALRIHHLDEGPRDGPIALCLHGQPAWSYLYRNVIPHLTAAGVRVLTPDLPGYGKSDKPAALADYSYERQVDWMSAWLEAHNFRGLTLFGQDWGGLIGLRLVARAPDRFERVVLSNTGLPHNPTVSDEVAERVARFWEEAPTPSLLGMQRALSRMGGDRHPAESFAYWQKWCWETVNPPVGMLMSLMLDQQSAASKAMKVFMNRLGTVNPFPTARARAYEAPFPDARYKMGVRAMPRQVPTLPSAPSTTAQGEAWAFFERFQKPVLCAFADNDPITRGSEGDFLHRIPGAQGRPHRKIPGGGHFVQEGAPLGVAKAILDSLRLA